MDIFVQLATESDPALVNLRKTLICEKCGEYGHMTRSNCCETELKPISGINYLIYSLEEHLYLI